MLENMSRSPRLTLKAARINAGYTQQQAAEMLGISRSALQRYENGKGVPAWDIVMRMSTLYKIHTDYLVFLPCDSAKSVIERA